MNCRLNEMDVEKTRIVDIQVMYICSKEDHNCTSRENKKHIQSDFIYFQTCFRRAKTSKRRKLYCYPLLTLFARYLLVNFITYNTISRKLKEFDLCRISHFFEFMCGLKLLKINQILNFLSSLLMEIVLSTRKQNGKTVCN